MKKTISLVLVLAFGLATEVAKADFTFGTPTNLGPTVNTSDGDWDPSISADGLSLYFCSNRPGGVGGVSGVSGVGDLWVTTRATTEDDWGEPVNLGLTVNTSSADEGPSISADGLALYFTSDRPGGFGTLDLYVSTRATKDDPWGAPSNLGSVVNRSGAGYPDISRDGLSLYFTSDRPGGYGNYDLWLTTRATTNDDWGEPVNLGSGVNSSSEEATPSISSDGLALYFTSDRPGGYGNYDLWLTMRATTNDEWGEPVNLGPRVNTDYLEALPNISGDGSNLYFQSNRPGGIGGEDLWQLSIIPVVDFNGDEKIDTEDLLIMIDDWGKSETLCDIGPMPWGDGIVDEEDLEVLMSYWGQEVEDPTLIAHWPLDETEGDIAQDSAGVNNAVVFGDALWQPDGGQVNGALQLDGVNDYVSTNPILDPAHGAFSIFAWIKGGVPGQVVISQTGLGGANWLLADPSEGNLMTELKGSGRGAAALLSQTVVTDGDWHRVGLTWDGTNRILYVDEVEVASDTQSNIEGSEGGLYIGAGKNLEPGSFFSGLIDDVRIYNRALIP